MSKIALTIEDKEDGGVSVKVNEVYDSAENSKAVIIANHMWIYLQTCIEEGIFDEL